jgi:hypothetical protein
MQTCATSEPASGDTMVDLSLLPVAFLLLAVLLILEARRLPRFEMLREELARLAARELARLGALERELSRLLHELKRHMPVYSARTIHGREAEFIRERLPKRARLVLFIVALFLFSAVAWWFGR